MFSVATAFMLVADARWLMIKTILAPAKINLCLHVLGRRSDGYHDLAMLMQRVSLFDEVRLRLVEGAGVSTLCHGLEMPAGEENLTSRAARLLLQESGVSRGVEIELIKHIPVAAGLGGGSSDAAAVLLGLNELAGLGRTRQDLMQLGVRLGADVPFFVLEHAAWATGIGDRLEPVASLPEVFYVLVNPGFPVSTAWVYQNLGLTSSGDVAKLRKFPRTTEGLVRLLHNDLERVTGLCHAEIASMRQRLVAHGAVGSLMSGSGATVFGVFTDKALADRAAEVIGSETGWWAVSVTPLP